MKHILRTCLVGGILWWHLGAPAWAQSLTQGLPMQQDTIVVYDTLYVTDTIWLDTEQPLPPVQQRAFVQLGGMESPSKKLLVFGNGGATFLSNYIIDSVNIIHLKNTDSMKKIGFFGVILLAFQQMVLAQNNITLNAGLGSYRMASNIQMVSKPAATFIGGLGYRRDLWSGKLSAGCELNFHYMLQSDFDTLMTVGQFAGAPNPLMQDADFTRNPFMFQLPVFLRWQTGWVNPSIGAEVYYKVIPAKSTITYQIFVPSTGTEVDRQETHRYSIPYVGFSLTGGLDIPLSSRLLLGLNYYHGLTAEQVVNFRGTEIKSSMKRWELKARYRLLGTPKQ